MQKTCENHFKKKLQKSIPEGSGGLLRASWAPGASQNCFQSPPGPQKNSMIAPGGGPERHRSHFSSKKKPGYHGTGSARDERTSSTAGGRRDARASEKRKDRSTSTERSSKAREARAALAASRRDCTIAAGLSHARCARALGRLELGDLIVNRELLGSSWSPLRTHLRRMLQALQLKEGPQPTQEKQEHT